jgi:hypothetical protein
MSGHSTHSDVDSHANLCASRVPVTDLRRANAKLIQYSHVMQCAYLRWDDVDNRDTGVSLVPFVHTIAQVSEPRLDALDLLFRIGQEAEQNGAHKGLQSSLIFFWSWESFAVPATLIQWLGPGSKKETLTFELALMSLVLLLVLSARNIKCSPSASTKSQPLLILLFRRSDLLEAGAMALELNSPLVPIVVSMAVFVFAMISFKPGSNSFSDSPGSVLT